jgi:hypothetical protein
VAAARVRAGEGSGSAAAAKERAAATGVLAAAWGCNTGEESGSVASAKHKLQHLAGIVLSNYIVQSKGRSHATTAWPVQPRCKHLGGGGEGLSGGGGEGLGGAGLGGSGGDGGGEAAS